MLLYHIVIYSLIISFISIFPGCPNGHRYVIGDVSYHIS